MSAERSDSAELREKKSVKRQTTRRVSRLLASSLTVPEVFRARIGVAVKLG
jgi:hypothetical protein